MHTPDDDSTKFATSSSSSFVRDCIIYQAIAHCNVRTNERTAAHAWPYSWVKLLLRKSLTANRINETRHRNKVILCIFCSSFRSFSPVGCLSFVLMNSCSLRLIDFIGQFRNGSQRDFFHQDITKLCFVVLLLLLLRIVEPQNIG